MSERFGCRRLLLLFPVLVVALLAASSAWPGATSAEDQSVDEVAVDVDVTGNGDAVLGTTEACNATPLEVGQTLDIDLVVRGIPSPGTFGVGFDMYYDPDVVTVESVQVPDGPSIIKAMGESMPFGLVVYGDGSRYELPLPEPASVSDSGHVRVDFVDLSGNFETGDGVLVRMTLRAIGPGVSHLQFLDTSTNGDPVGVIARGGLFTFTSDSFSGGAITVGEGAGCPALVPTLSPTPTGNTPIPTRNSPTRGPTISPTRSPTISPTRSPTITPAITIATGGPTAGAGGDGTSLVSGGQAASATPGALPRGGGATSSGGGDWIVALTAVVLGVAAAVVAGRRKVAP